MSFPSISVPTTRRVVFDEHSFEAGIHFPRIRFKNESREQFQLYPSRQMETVEMSFRSIFVQPTRVYKTTLGIATVTPT